MSKTNTTKHPTAVPDLDAATVERLKLLERQRERARRTLLKRRQRKSGQ